LDASDRETQPSGRNWENQINLLLVVPGYKVFIFIGHTLAPHTSLSLRAEQLNQISKVAFGPGADGDGAILSHVWFTSARMEPFWRANIRFRFGMDSSAEKSQTRSSHLNGVRPVSTHTMEETGAHCAEADGVRAPQGGVEPEVASGRWASSIDARSEGGCGAPVVAAIEEGRRRSKEGDDSSRAVASGFKSGGCSREAEKERKMGLQSAAAGLATPAIPRWSSRAGGGYSRRAVGGTEEIAGSGCGIQFAGSNSNSSEATLAQAAASSAVCTEKGTVGGGIAHRRR
jgi:hypothetical protein